MESNGGANCVTKSREAVIVKVLHDDGEIVYGQRKDTLIRSNKTSEARGREQRPPITTDLSQLFAACATTRRIACAPYSSLYFSLFAEPFPAGALFRSR